MEIGSNKDFWEAVRNQLDEVELSSNIMVLSPRQFRAYRLWLAKAPTDNFISRSRYADYDMYPLGDKFFDERFQELCACRLVDFDSLEEKYKQILARNDGAAYTTSLQAKERLLEMVGRKDMSADFATLWQNLITTEGMKKFLYYFRPYIAREKSIWKNENSIVEMYIYALWVYWGWVVGRYSCLSEEGTKGNHYLRLSGPSN